MNRLMQWIDRLKLVEGLILVGTVWFGVEWFGSRWRAALKSRTGHGCSKEVSAI
jgi:hypothetical protein